MILKIPAVAVKGTEIIGESSHTISMDKDFLTLSYNYEQRRLLEFDNPGLGFSASEKIRSEFVIKKDYIRMVSVCRDDQDEVFVVAVDFGALLVDATIPFKNWKEAMELRRVILNWWLNKEEIKI